MNVTIIGGGSWGSALAIHLGRRDVPVRLWIREPEILEAVRRDQTNPVFLPGFTFPRVVTFEADIAQAARGASIIFIAVPSQFCRPVYASLAPAVAKDSLVVSLTKGLEERTLKRMSQVLAGSLTRIKKPRIAVLSGPSFAREVAQGLPTAVVAASSRGADAVQVQHLLSGPTFRVYTCRDMTGVELAGAAKNVIAIAAGISDALDSGHNAKASLITRGLVEITRLGVRLGARRETFFGLAGIGDLILTCTGELSRNRHVGHELGLGKPLRVIVAGSQMVAEGVVTTRIVHRLARRHGVEMPICEQVYKVLYQDKDPRRAIIDLMSRKLKGE
jgi:glycerol-3-phosphate dehydrogenase (NAD(P)+)